MIYGTRVDFIRYIDLLIVDVEWNCMILTICNYTKLELNKDTCITGNVL